MDIFSLFRYEIQGLNRESKGIAGMERQSTAKSVLQRIQSGEIDADSEEALTQMRNAGLDISQDDVRRIRKGLQVDMKDGGVSREADVSIFNIKGMVRETGDELPEDDPFARANPTDSGARVKTGPNYNRETSPFEYNPDAEIMRGPKVNGGHRSG